MKYLFPIALALCMAHANADPRPHFYPSYSRQMGRPVPAYYLARQVDRPNWYTHYQLSRQMDDESMEQVAPAQLLPSDYAAEELLRQAGGQEAGSDEPMFQTQRQDPGAWGTLGMNGPAQRSVWMNENEFVFGLRPYIRTDAPGAFGPGGAPTTPGVPAGGGATTPRPVLGGGLP